MKNFYLTYNYYRNEKLFSKWEEYTKFKIQNSNFDKTFQDFGFTL